ncbi:MULTISPECIES: exonuclease SbcCD subunit D [Niallia]|jgi:DNA repair protein SbcD/Mre11|uniref:Nuclease SbcCD subunit D n=1 Tax=Niallia circulans TaxID=1397 RepID=A0A268FID1_NIACI|nr:exonuclease SbcCD subunit D [Niallia circulans]AYV66377.1 exonuclease SbcCD subunit D [Niallia circulans]AYV70805.1 exonuclease SbcCD subunit D [Niallia circulans]NRG28148.1 exonuclease SbcCD subunit D [Niallia circulans]PAD85107.1 exonuclease sbcCD subunit D [Niallia circulans]QJX62268.1 exonuclease SbcCD subunit D [Niallia circulans]
MKFIHTADWHLGKLVHGLYMTEDQRFMLKQFMDLVEKEKPDAVIIAGDLYDRSIPPTDAVNLLDEVLYFINVELNTPILAISGNHDSAERLSFGSSWYQKNRFYLNGKIENSFTPISFSGVNFYLVPYCEPVVVRKLLADDTILNHHDAMKAIISKIESNLNINEPNVFIGHSFVLGGKTTDSERILSVGGSGCVGAELFAPFSYTALGHLHSPDAIHHPTVKYSGSLMKYSFSEAKQKKSVSIIEIDEKGNFTQSYQTLMPKRDMREMEGYLEELLDVSYYQQQKVDDYLKITLLDEGAILDPIQKLRQVYPNVLHLERKIENKDRKEKSILQVQKEVQKNELELFASFYEEMTTADFTQEKQEWMTTVINQVLREEGAK